MFWPPMKAERSGVISPKWPTTVTLTVLPSASAHGDGVQLSDTSVGVMPMIAPLDSVRTAHMTRFVDASQGALATNDVGLWSASRAPARAAFSTTIRA